ncbi:hypothetical protein [Raoultella planticola]|uniref:hypothetical protein n=1 Tax=Raoultella planticola TaxID=575 RepID=UPI0034E42997
MNINEKLQWEENVKLLTRLEKVEGGRSGAANTQAEQLANRTRWLKAQIESVKDGREHTFYTSESDPDGTIAGMGGTEEGDLFRVSLGPDSDGAFAYYWHLNGQAVKDTTLPSAAAVENLIPLNRQAKYLVAKQGAGSFPFAEEYDEIGLDKFNNIIHRWKGMNFTTLLNWFFPYVETKLLNLNGKPVTDENLLDAPDRNNLSTLSGVRKFENKNTAQEMPFAEPFDEVSKDSENNLMWAFRGRKYFNYMDCVYRDIDVRKLTLNGVLIDVDGFFDSGDKENLTRFSRSSEMIDADAFPFNPTAWTVFDKNRNVIFRVEDYWAALARLDALNQKVEQMGEQKENPLLPFTETDAAGKSQVSVFNRETGQQTRITDGDSNETAPRQDGENRVVWQSDRSDNAPGGLFFARLPDLKPRAYIARKKIVGWGHSFINNGAFLNRLHALTGLPVYNFGLAGQTSDAIAARQGGAPAYYAPVGGVIPAAGAVTLTPAVPGPCRSLAAPVDLSCRLAGVDGTFSWDGTNAKFTRKSAGEAVHVAVLAPLYVYPVTTVNVSGSIPAGTLYEQHDECINIFWIARNSLNQTDLNFNSMVSMVEYVKNFGKEIAILADFNSAAEPVGSAGYNQMMDINSRWQDKYPEFYCEVGGVDIRENFINHANPASSGDMEDVAAGLTPRSLRYDSLHPSQQINGNGGSLTPELALDYGANVNAVFTRDFLTQKGWL